MTKRTLVLGAGGHAAIAWEIGMIAGMADAGLDLRDADRFIGTSAGSIVAAQITSRLDLEELFQRQVDPGLQVDEPSPAIDFAQWRAELKRIKEGAEGAADFLQRIGSLTVAPTASQVDRRNMIASRLPVHGWPDRNVLVVAVDVDNGERCVFDRSSHVPLIDAVAASCAVAGIWQAIQIRGHHYVDGAFYSIDNADLALGTDRVVIITLPASVPLCVLCRCMRPWRC